MKLSAGYFLVAQKLYESATAMCHEDIRTRLQDCLRDSFSGTGNWCYIVAVFGDDKSGDVVYSCNSDLKKAAYTLGAGLTKIAVDAAVDVQPLTTYEPEVTEVLEAGRRNSTRDLKQLQSIHDAATGLGATCAAAGRESQRSGQRGASERRSADIVNSESSGAVPASGNLPAGHANGNGKGAAAPSEEKLGVGDTSNSSAHREAHGSGTADLVVSKTLQIQSLQLVESTAWGEELQLIESSGKEVEIKIIAPGKGSSAFYPTEVLKRDGPGVFKKNTQIYINHATAAEESARPEGDWHKLAGALSSDAYWKESTKTGAGLYAMAKFASEVAPSVIEKAPYSGMSIRANGTAVMEAGRAKLQDGVPVLEKFTGCESIDVVTRAGAGGMILTEAARAANPTEGADQMDAAELKKLNEALAAQAVNNAKLLERAIRSDAREAAVAILGGIEMAETCKARVIENVLRDLPKTEAGELDAVKFGVLVNEEAKREAAYVAQLTGAGRITGMGSSVETPANPEDAKKLKEAGAALNKRATDVFGAFGIPEAGLKLVAKEYGEAA